MPLWIQVGRATFLPEEPTCGTPTGCLLYYYDDPCLGVLALFPFEAGPFLICFGVVIQILVSAALRFLQKHHFEQSDVAAYRVCAEGIRRTKHL